MADEPEAQSPSGLPATEPQDGSAPIEQQAPSADEEAGDDSPVSDGSEAAGPDGAKRKRRRRKKRKGTSAPGTEEAPETDGQTEARPKRRDTPMAPFLRYFMGGHANRRHGFAVGEVVAGRVKEVAHGVITVDLFGKGLAYADEFEPRELPPLPETLAVTSVGEPAPEVETPADDQTPVLDEATADETALEASGADGGAETEHESTLAGEEEAPTGDEAHDAAHAAHGPLEPAPVVPESFPRPEPPALGQVFRGRVSALSESGHIALVNRLIDRQAVLANLTRYRAERRRVEGVVFGFNRGGFDVIVEGARAFCPASAMTLSEPEDPAHLLGQKVEFLLPASQSRGNDIIVSRRSILERMQRRQARELLRSLTPGQRVKGKVTSVREFGIFVDIGGVEGLVHQSELSFAHGVKPSDIAVPGDEVEVQVLRVGGGPETGRRERVERVSLSIKAVLPDPWDAHGDALAEGTPRVGKVVSTTDFGAFVELLPQIEGLLHITELGRDLAHANQAVKEGDEVIVVIERADRATRRISLSKITEQEMKEYEASKAAGAPPPSNVRPGSRIKVKVARVESRGLVVRISGVLGKRARGYVPSTEMGERGGDLRKLFPQGSEIEVKVVGVERDGSLRCSPKALAVDEERRAIKDYRRDAAKQGFGTFGDLLKAKLGQASE